MASICWAPDGSAIYGAFREGLENTAISGLQSVSTESGAVKRLLTYPMGRGISILTPAEGGRALLVSFEDQPPLARRAGVIRYDLITGQETELISRESAAQAVPSPDGAREAALGRVVKGVREVSVKPLQGGDWKTLGSSQK